MNELSFLLRIRKRMIQVQSRYFPVAFQGRFSDVPFLEIIASQKEQNDDFNAYVEIVKKSKLASNSIKALLRIALNNRMFESEGRFYKSHLQCTK
jgi:hypothetical protein